MPHRVEMYRLTDSVNSTVPWGTWETKLPDGSILVTAGSTTQGLQESVNYAATHGFDLKVFGGQVRHNNFQNPAIIMCTTPLVFPPLELGNIEIGGTLNFCGPSPQPVAVIFDSIMASRILITGQIVVAPNWGCGVQFKPRSELPCDQNGPIITASTVLLPSVVMTGGGGVCIDFDASMGSISGNIFEILEPNDGAVGVRVHVDADHCFDHNRMLIREIHAQDTGIDAGVSLGKAAQIFGNVWDVAIQPSSIGVQIFGRNERWTISIDDREGSPTHGFTLNPGASHNIIDVLRHDVGTVCNDASGNATNVVNAP